MYFGLGRRTVKQGNGGRQSGLCTGTCVLHTCPHLSVHFQVLITIYWLGRKAHLDAFYSGPQLNFKAFEGLLGLALSRVNGCPCFVFFNAIFTSFQLGNI